MTAAIRDVECFDPVPTIIDLNDLEARIAAANGDADSALWEQAVIVAQLLESGISQRRLAAGWINLRTGRPYTRRHVQIVAQVAGCFNSHPRPNFRKTYNAISNAPNEDRCRVCWNELNDAERRELRRIAAEMGAFPFVAHTFIDPGPGLGGDLEVVGGAAGASVYWDIVGGDPKGGRGIFKYTRGAVSQKINAFITKGVRSVISNLAVDVARRRLAADRSLSGPMLPPSAGDIAGTTIWLDPVAVADAEMLSPILGTRDIAETVAAALALLRQQSEGSTVAPSDDEDDLPDSLDDQIPDYSDLTDLHDEEAAYA
jgi:hypothetical protein